MQTTHSFSGGEGAEVEIETVAGVESGEAGVETVLSGVIVEDGVFILLGCVSGVGSDSALVT